MVAKTFPAYWKKERKYDMIFPAHDFPSLWES